MVALQRTTPVTEEWLQFMGQDVCVDNSCSWVQSEDDAPAVLLQGRPIPTAACFHQLGVEVAIGGVGIFCHWVFGEEIV